MPKPLAEPDLLCVLRPCLKTPDVIESWTRGYLHSNDSLGAGRGVSSYIAAYWLKHMPRKWETCWVGMLL